MNEKAQLLDNYRISSGKKKSFVSEKINVSRPRLNTILKHPETATTSQADGLCKEFGINKKDRDFIFLP